MHFVTFALAIVLVGFTQALDAPALPVTPHTTSCDSTSLQKRGQVPCKFAVATQEDSSDSSDDSIQFTQDVEREYEDVIIPWQATLEELKDALPELSEAGRAEVLKRVDLFLGPAYPKAGPTTIDNVFERFEHMIILAQSFGPENLEASDRREQAVEEILQYQLEKEDLNDKLSVMYLHHIYRK